MASYLSEVPPDVVFSIFICCDIATVVSVGRTCRYLHDLTLQKSVWLALVEDLRRRFFLPEIFIPNLEETSTTDLIVLVKRILTGPETWSPTSSGFTPEVSKRITLHPTIRHGAGILSWENEARLSPSGRFVLFNNWKTLECWDVAADVLIWTHVPGLDRARVCLFAMDEIVDGDSLIIMICERTYSHQRKNYIEIVELNPRSGTQANLLQVRCPNTSYDNSLAAPAILGNVAVVALSASADAYLVMDWKSQVAFAVEASGTHGMLMEIIPGHFILKTRHLRDGSGDLYLISVQAALLSHATPVDLHAGAPFNPVTVDQLPKILAQSIMSSPEGSHRSDHQLSVHPSPLHRDVYRVWVFHSPKYIDPDAVLCSYDLVLLPAYAPSWNERTRVPARSGLYHHRIAYSGHTEFFERIEGRVVPQVVPPVIPSTRGELDLGDPADPIHVSAYFGALTFATDSEVVILYFR
ncbi:hypothetical protein C8F04DRAFT_1147223 [Mycena alexandri]|uniref:F-box domain-containing protein n=1 Tax=Mycena alexandri TaxID=1745969 RepID=A0AAD6S277_9AGAR|nr:hypothetical protein C8F04DRAFT_1147223 [Mycena alexandri]